MKHIIFILLCLISYSVSSQTNSKKECESYLSNGYISDGQYNIASIKKNEVKTTKVTLLAGNTYRIVVCSEITSKLRFEILDQEDNLLFSNKNYGYTPYWDFEIKETLECKIRLYIDELSIEMDNTTLLIGYKQ